MCIFWVIKKQIVLLNTKFLDFFYTLRTFYFTLCVIKKNLQKILFKLLFIKVKKFHGDCDSVKNESARANKLEGGAKRPAPQPV